MHINVSGETLPVFWWQEGVEERLSAEQEQAFGPHQTKVHYNPIPLLCIHSYPDIMYTV